MKWWNRFWKQRKESDRIKVQVIAGCIGLVCFCTAVYHGITFWQMVRTPVEYICTITDADGNLEAKISQMKELDYVDAVSRQQTDSVEITTQRGTLTIPCLRVSEDYLRDAYGLADESAMQIFYFNQAAYENIRNTLQSSEEITDSHVGYIMSEEKGTAKLVSGSSVLPDDSPYVFCTGDPVRLQKEGKQLRVRVRQQDLDGMQVKELQGMGLQVENQNRIEENRLLQEQKWIEIKYNLLIAALCLVFVWCLKKYGK